MAPRPPQDAHRASLSSPADTGVPSDPGASSSSATPPPPPHPLPLPMKLSKNSFYLSPLANPDLVLAIVLPGHPLYGEQAVLPAKAREGQASKHKGDKDKSSSSSSGKGGVGSALSKFFGTGLNSVTNTAASTIGVKNQLELNRPKLRLVPRTLPDEGMDDNPSAFALRVANQKWVISKRDGCVYSCVEEKEGGGLTYKLGMKRNQMYQVRSKEESKGGAEAGGAAHHPVNQQLGELPRTTAATTTPGQKGAAATSNGQGRGSEPPSSTRAPSVTADSSKVGSTTAASSSTSSSSNGTGGTVSPSSSPSPLLTITTAQGKTVICPLHWEHDLTPLKADTLKDLTAINGIQVIIEDLEVAPGGLLGDAVNFLSRPIAGSVSATAAAAPSTNAFLRPPASRWLITKHSCCGKLDCELERIDVGTSVSFKGLDEGYDPPANGPAGPNIKQVWRVESDFSIWLSSLSRSMSTDYQVTRKLQEIEAERRRIRENTPDPAPHPPLKFTVDYTYTPIWSTEGTKATNPASLWRPTLPAGEQWSYFGDLMTWGVDQPIKKESLVVLHKNGKRHPALIKPVDFKLVYTKKKGKMGHLFVWEPIPPPGVDALALGHIATSGPKEESSKPSVDCGVVLVHRDLLKDSNQPLPHSIWIDTKSGGGDIGSFWRAGPLHTFFCNPRSHSPPTGSYYVLLPPEELPEKCPLLRPLDTMSAPWDSVWDDKGTLAKMDISIWRPHLDGSFVRFGDQIVRGHAPPRHPSVVARDHPAFRRPVGYERVTKFYRGTRKCYVYRPLVPSSDYVALGYVVCAHRDEVPHEDWVRVVHKDALIPLGVLKQMWIEHHAGMISTLSLGITDYTGLSSKGVVNMLWKNRSLNTFIAVQNTHTRPEEYAHGHVYRLTMSSSELAHTAHQLESHARWVLESIYEALRDVELKLGSSGYSFLKVTPTQAATMFQAIKGVYKLLRADREAKEEREKGDANTLGADGTLLTPAFDLSPSFTSYLMEYQTDRLREVERSFKRFLYQEIVVDLSDHEATLVTLDDYWDLLDQMGEVHRVYDRIEEWEPPVNPAVRFPASTHVKPFRTFILDDHIGREIFERFLQVFPPKVSDRGMGDDADEEDEVEEDLPAPTVLDNKDKDKDSKAKKEKEDKKNNKKKGKDDEKKNENDEKKQSPTTSSDSKSPMPSSDATNPSSNPGMSDASAEQLAETKAVLAKLDAFREELDSVIGLTDRLPVRKLYLEYYNQYICHTLQTEFPLIGRSARSASTGRKLTMSSLLAIVSWCGEYMDLVEFDLLEGVDGRYVRNTLVKMEELVDRFMDAHDEHAKVKILKWIGNLLSQEEKASVELRMSEEEDERCVGGYKHFYYTSGPSDLFLNINTLFDSQSASLTGRPLARIALVHVHVITYYQQVQLTFFKQLRAVGDGTTHDTVRGRQASFSDAASPNNNRNNNNNNNNNKSPPPSHAGTLDKPYSYILSQINNTTQYQQHVEDLCDRVVDRLEDADLAGSQGDLIASLQDAFAACSEEFDTVALGATEVLLRHIQNKLEAPLSKLFVSSVWGADANYLQTGVIDELDELSSFFVPNIQPHMCQTHLLREGAKHLLRGYMRFLCANLKSNLSAPNMHLEDVVLPRIKSDRDELREYVESCRKWNVASYVEKEFDKIECFIDFLSVDVDFLKLQLPNITKLFQDDADLPPAYVISTLISLRGDITSDDRKAWMLPYAADLKLWEEARKVAAANLAALNKAAATGKVGVKPLLTPTSSSSSLGSTPYGLDITLLRGQDLVVKDITTSDPYVNIILFNRSGGRLDKRRSKVIEKNLNPLWNERFEGWKTSDVSLMDRIRFEVWDKDFISKDFMGYAEVTLAELRDKQLLQRKTSWALGNGASPSDGMGSDYTQEPVHFHLKLLPREGRKNAGSDLVSGYIDVRIRYFKLIPGGLSPAPSSSNLLKNAQGGKNVAASGFPTIDEDDIDFEPEEVGQTGSKRPAASSVSSSNAAASATALQGLVSPMTAATLVAANTQANAQVPLPASKSGAATIDLVNQASAPLWNDIVGSIKLAKPTAGEEDKEGGEQGAALPHKGDASPLRTRMGSAFRFGKGKRGSGKGKTPVASDNLAVPAASPAASPAGAVGGDATPRSRSKGGADGAVTPRNNKKRVSQKEGSTFNIFGLF